LETGDVITTVVQPFLSLYSDPLIDPKGNYVLTQSPAGEGSIDVLSVLTGATTATITDFAGEDRNGGAVWVGDDLLISRRQTADHPPDLALVDPATGAVKRTFGGADESDRPVDLPVSTAALASDSRLASFHTDFDRYELAIWGADEETPPDRLWTSEEVPDAVSRLVWSPAGHVVLAVYEYAGLGIYDVNEGTVLWQCITGDACALAGPVVAAEFSPNGEQIAVAYDNTVSVLDAATGKRLWEIKAHDNTVQGLTWIEAPPWPGATDQVESARTLLLTWSGDGTARLWDDRAHQVESVRYTGLDSITDAALSPDGRHLSLISENGGLNVWRFWPLDPEAMLATADCLATRGLTPKQVQEFGLPEESTARPVCTSVLEE
jgi:WD40 repeat protein